LNLGARLLLFESSPAELKERVLPREPGDDKTSSRRVTRANLFALRPPP
jgi:hypothetical protein